MSGKPPISRAREIFPDLAELSPLEAEERIAEIDRDDQQVAVLSDDAVRAVLAAIGLGATVCHPPSDSGIGPPPSQGRRVLPLRPACAS